MNKLSILTAALVLSGAAFAADPAQGTSRSLTDLAPKDEKAMAEALHHANQSEIRLGKLAQQKGQSQAVKRFGQMMVTDHQKADQELLSLARTKGWKLADEPTATNQTERVMMAADKANEARLNALDGPLFDSAYLSMMVDDHDVDIMKVALGAKQFEGSELGKQLTRLLPTLEQHRQHAYQALGEVKPNPEALGMGGAGSAGQRRELKQPR
ncbi:MAG: DUF4142 domain-containing protein [Myxococcaceae bacterium]|nr:DUF4142 domain-containing protein [Myxococcaceae bacterium]